MSVSPPSVDLDGRSLVLVWAMDRRGVIGRDGALPWRLSDDLKQFKRLTRDAPVIMGRKTFESIGKPLPRRTNIAISAEPRTTAGIRWVASLDEALQAALDATEPGDAIFVLGGSTIYAAALDIATSAQVTFVDAEVTGDVVLPFSFPSSDWREVSAVDYAASEVNDYAFSIRTFERIGTRSGGGDMEIGGGED